MLASDSAYINARERFGSMATSTPTLHESLSPWTMLPTSFTIVSYNVNYGMASPRSLAVMLEAQPWRHHHASGSNRSSRYDVCTSGLRGADYPAYPSIIFLTETTPAWERLVRGNAIATKRYPHIIFQHVSGGAGGMAVLSSVPLQSIDWWPPAIHWFGSCLVTVRWRTRDATMSASSTTGVTPSLVLSLDRKTDKHYSHSHGSDNSGSEVDDNTPLSRGNDNKKRANTSGGSVDDGTIGNGDDGWTTLRILNVHLRPARCACSYAVWQTRHDRLQEVQDMLQRLRRGNNDAPLIMVGDFNEDDGPAIRTLTEYAPSSGGALLRSSLRDHAPSLPTWRMRAYQPFFTCPCNYDVTYIFDHILYSEHLICDGATSIYDGDSDHLPVVAAFTWRNGGRMARDHERQQRLRAGTWAPVRRWSKRILVVAIIAALIWIIVHFTR